MSLLGVGIDVADVGRISRLVERHGTRFTSRWFTSSEAAECQRSESPAQEFASRFAAKEAVWKSLGMSSRGPVPWRSIAILRPDGEPTVELAGDVARAARAREIGGVRIAITVGEGRAIAVAIAEERTVGHALPMRDARSPESYSSRSSGGIR